MTLPCLPIRRALANCMQWIAGAAGRRARRESARRFHMQCQSVIGDYARLCRSGTTFAEPSSGIRSDWRLRMKRREFLKSMTALAAGGVLPGARRLVARQGAGAPGDAADRLRKRAQQHRHPRRRHQRAGLRGVVELLRPPDQPRDEDAAERRAVLRPRQVQDGTGRGHERRRHVGHLQAARRTRPSRTARRSPPRT